MKDIFLLSFYINKLFFKKYEIYKDELPLFKTLLLTIEVYLTLNIPFD